MKYQLNRKLTGRIGGIVALFFLSCPHAEAHLVTTGLGPVYDGIAHMALSPADLAIVIVITFLAAMRGARSGRLVLALLPIVWLTGGIAGLVFPVNASGEWVTGLSLLLVGGLVAADRNLPVNLVSGLTSFIGLIHGFLTGTALFKATAAGLELAGELVALVIVITIVAGVVVSLKEYWMRTVIRVLGSWIAATGLLLIGWSLRAGI